MSLDAKHLGCEKDVDFFGSENAPDFFRDVRILAAKELRPMLDHGDAAAEAPVGLGEFEAHIAAAENDQVLGHPVEFEKLDVSQRPGIRQPGNRRNRGVGAQVQENAVACQHARATGI